MSPYKISKQAWMTAPETVKLMDALHDNGGDARFAGGCVRDALANRKTNDIDIATPLTPDEVIARLNAHNIKHAPTGLKHGTVTAIVDGKPFEITTLRIDMTTYGRLADVTFTDDWRKDAARRDFTINAMFADREGHVYDYFTGAKDLRDGRIIFVGDPEQRIKEDVLRILRFFRFSAFYGRGNMDAKALDACNKHAKSLPHLSAERIRQEILKLLDSNNCVSVWRAMLTHGVVTHFMPEAMNTDALERLVTLEKKHHTEAFNLRRMAALLDVMPDGIDHITGQLRLSNHQSLQLKNMLTPPSSVSTNMTEQDVRKLVYSHGNDMARNLLFLAAAKSGKIGNLDTLYDMATRFRAPVLPVQGKDILERGVPAGENVGKTLRALEDWWIAQDFQPGRTVCLQKLEILIQK